MLASVARVMPLVKRLAADITNGDGHGKGVELLQSQTVEGPWRSTLDARTLDSRLSTLERSRTNMGWEVSWVQASLP